MKLTFLGATETVTDSKYLFENEYDKVSFAFTIANR
jgi:hypothetical protein